MELTYEDKLIKELDRFLETKGTHRVDFSIYTELDLFTDIQYLRIIESQLKKCEKETKKTLEKCKNPSTKIVSKSYTVLTPTYLKRKLKQVVEAEESIQKVITTYLSNASQYAGIVDTNDWFEWWEEYMESLTDAEYAYIAECKKQLQEPVSIRPTKSLERFVLERQIKLKEQFKTLQKDYTVTPGIA